MLAEEMIELRAVDRARNIFRAWRCELGTDLFGEQLVTVTFGRTGTTGRTISRAAPSRGEALRLMGRALARRASAERRIGVGYRVVTWRGFTSILRTDLFLPPPENEIERAGAAEGDRAGCRTDAR